MDWLAPCVVGTPIVVEQAQVHVERDPPNLLGSTEGPEDTGGGHCRGQGREAIRLVHQFGAQGLYPVNLALHCRFLGASSTWLATDYGRQTCVIEVATAKGTPHWQDFYRRMEECWFAIPKARPHWGKVYTTARQLKDRYERMDDFLARRQAWDPDRVFLNDFLENKVFQLNEAAAPAEAARYPACAPAQVAMVS